MPLFYVLPYPIVDPVLVHLGPVSIHWYSLAYSGGLLAIWLCARSLVKRESLWNNVPRPTLASLDFLVIYILVGTAVGGRLGYVIIKPEAFLADPSKILTVWQGGGVVHSAMLGGIVAAAIFAWRNGCSFLTVCDICAPGAALGLFFGRLANFIKPELWGRPTDVPWAMVFPGAGPLPRHPSQLYEGALEGLLMFVVLLGAARAGALQRPGLLAGLFSAGYGIARIICELFREPDPDLYVLPYDLAFGMLFSIPMVVGGVLILLFVLRRRET